MSETIALNPQRMQDAAGKLSKRVAYGLQIHSDWFLAPGPPGLSNEASARMGRVAGHLRAVREQELNLSRNISERADVLIAADKAIGTPTGVVIAGTSSGVAGSITGTSGLPVRVAGSKGMNAAGWASFQTTHNPKGPDAEDRKQNGWEGQWGADNGWYFDCIKFALLAWARAGMTIPLRSQIPGGGNARDYATYFQQHGGLHRGEPPAGAMVFYDFSGAYGHVAIADGSGGIYSTVDPATHGGSQLAHYSAADLAHRGWTNHSMGWSMGGN